MRRFTIKKYKVLFISGLLTMIVFITSPIWAITITDPFGPNGEAGYINNTGFPPSLSIGAGGEVVELDAFLNIAGSDLNSGFFGTSAQFAFDPLPAGLNFSFSSSLSADTTDLNLIYKFFNNTGGILNDVQFLSFLDAEIDEPINTFFNEFGEVIGNVGVGATDPDPDSWEIDEPTGFFGGDIFDNLLLGMLDNTNAFPIGFPDDVSMALGFSLGNLNPFDTARINILISEDGDSIGSLALAQHDSDPLSTTVITMSGKSNVAPIPEPSTFILLGTGLVGLGFFGRRRWLKR